MQMASNDKMVLKAKDERLLFDTTSIKEKLKANCSPSQHLSRRTGPMRNDVGRHRRTCPYSILTWLRHRIEIARHSSDVQLHVSANAEFSREAVLQPSRSPSPITPAIEYLEFSKLLARRPISPQDRRRTYSPKRLRTRSGSPNNRSVLQKNVSLGSGDFLHAETVRATIKKLGHGRLYLLHKHGPHSFTIADDISETKFRVSIGPQTCSCGPISHCVHLLFVMIRVLKVAENDPRILSKKLKNFEVESLIHDYEERRKRRLGPSKHATTPSPDSTTKESFVTETALSPLLSEQISDHDDGSCCICLMQLSEREKLVTCSVCKNKLHESCMQILCKMNEEDNEPVKCPYCRHIWPSSTTRNLSQEKISSSATLQTHDISSTFVETISQDISDDNQFVSGLIGQFVKQSTVKLDTHRYQEAINCAWLEVFDSALICRLASREWSIRENTLKTVISQAEILMSNLVNDDSQFDITQSPQWLKVTGTFADILRVMVTDPVYRVFGTCLHGVASLLGYYLCITEEDIKALHTFVEPIIDIILTKCADGNRRTAQTSTDLIIGLCHGQAGELSVGRDTVCPMQNDVFTPTYILSCLMGKEIADECSNCKGGWQKILGRLYALDELMETFPQEFHLVQIQMNKENLSQNGKSNSQFRLMNRGRIIEVIKFALKFSKYSHENVRKMVERVVIRAIRLTQHVRPVYNQAYHLLASMEPLLADRIRDKLAKKDSILTNDEIVMYTSVRLPNRRHTLGRSAPVSPIRALPGRSPMSSSDNRKGRHEDVYFPQRRVSLPNVQRNLNTLAPAMSFCLPMTPSSSSTSLWRNPIQGSSSPKLIRPNFLPLNVHRSHEAPTARIHETRFGRRECEARVAGEESVCCFNEICHVHPLRCEGKCKPKRQRMAERMPPSVPPNTPLYSDGTAGMCADRLKMFCAQPVPYLDVIPEANSANILALKLKEMTYPKSLLSPRNSIASVNTERLSPSMGHCFSERANVIGTNSSYIEGIHWVRCELLGSGAFSSCYLGRDMQTGTLMAVKQVSFHCCNPEEQEKRRITVRDEILMMMKLDHPNIVRLLGASEQTNNYDLFVEWMPGGSVATILHRFGPFSDTVIILYMSHVLSGLGYLHDNRILHRDLKGANLLIDSTGHHLRIGDFGVAKRLVSHSTLSGECRGEVLGTIAFMAPEVLRGEAYGRACDVWSVGCCVIEMVTTKPPWNVHDFTNDNALIYRIAASVSPPPIPENMSPIIRNFTLRCLQPSYSDRPTVRELQTLPCFEQEEKTGEMN